MPSLVGSEMCIRDRILTAYTEARGALAKARIARGFYPVVVPADTGPQPRFGRAKKPEGGKGKSKG